MSYADRVVLRPEQKQERATLLWAMAKFGLKLADAADVLNVSLVDLRGWMRRHPDLRPSCALSMARMCCNTRPKPGLVMEFKKGHYDGEQLRDPSVWRTGSRRTGVENG